MKRSYKTPVTLLIYLLSIFVFSKNVLAVQYHPALCHSLNPTEANDIVYVDGFGLKNISLLSRKVICPFDLKTSGLTTASVWVNNGYIPPTSPQMTCTLNGYFYSGSIITSVTRSSDPLFERFNLSVPAGFLTNFAVICNMPPNSRIKVLESNL